MPRTLTFDNTDTSNIRYSGQWTIDGEWRDRNGPTGSLSSTKDQSAQFTFSFPEEATEFRFYGVERCCGGSYTISISNGPPETIDAVNTSDDGQNPPKVLYRKTFARAERHEVVIRNQADGRYVGGNSQITLDRLELVIPDEPPPPPPPTSSSTTRAEPSRTTSAPTTSGGETSTGTSRTSTSTGTSTGTGTAGSTTTSNSSDDTRTPNPNQTSASFNPGSLTLTSLPSGDNTGDTNLPSPTIPPSPSNKVLAPALGGALGGVAFIALLLLLLFCLRRRKRKEGGQVVVAPAPYPAGGVISPLTLMSETPSSGMIISSSEYYDSTSNSSGAPPPPRRQLNEKGRYINSTPRGTPSSGAQPVFLDTSSSAARSRRERDAGLLMTSDDDADETSTSYYAETLPPDYDQVFSGRARQSRVTRTTTGSVSGSGFGSGFGGER